MYCPLPSIQLGRCTLIWKSATQQQVMGLHCLCHIHPQASSQLGEGGFGVTGKSLETTENPSLELILMPHCQYATCFDYQGFHTDALGLEARYRFFSALYKQVYEWLEYPSITLTSSHKGCNFETVSYGNIFTPHV